MAAVAEASAVGTLAGASAYTAGGVAAWAWTGA